MNYTNLEIFKIYTYLGMIGRGTQFTKPLTERKEEEREREMESK